MVQRRFDSGSLSCGLRSCEFKDSSSKNPKLRLVKWESCSMHSDSDSCGNLWLEIVGVRETLGYRDENVNNFKTCVYNPSKFSFRRKKHRIGPIPGKSSGDGLEFGEQLGGEAGPVLRLNSDSLTLLLLKFNSLAVVKKGLRFNKSLEKIFVKEGNLVHTPNKRWRAAALQGIGDNLGFRQLRGGERSFGSLRMVFHNFAEGDNSLGQSVRLFDKGKDLTITRSGSGPANLTVDARLKI